MTQTSIALHAGRRATRRLASLLVALLAMVVAVLGGSAALAGAPPDPRVGLKSGVADAGQASRNMVLLSNTPPSAGFFDAKEIGAFTRASSDLAFKGTLVFQGGWQGVQVWDMADPKAPKLRLAFPCRGGQGDPSVYGNLLFISVEALDGRVDCGTKAIADTTVSAERFRGVRIFDMTDLDHLKQVAAVQTCRGSHTHTLVTDPKDPKHIYVYVQGTGPVRPAAELAGCSKGAPDKDPNTSLFRIEIIRVPLAAPQNAKVIAAPRIFADATTGAMAGLNEGGDHGKGTQVTATTDRCHDITVYPAIGLAAGACSGNGIILDIRNPAKPKRVAEVSDPNFAYWHSATFNNAGDKVLFSDEWGGGMGARCRVTDRNEWGADAIFVYWHNRLTLASYYKLPAAQSDAENCVAHNGSLVPVPGRDVLVQAWYQGGISVLDFTVARKPVEIAFFDRGPITDKIVLGGHWSAYWYNGHVVASEIARGLDVLELTPSDQLSQNELDAAKLVQFKELNAQMQPKLTWPAVAVVARAYLDQLARNTNVAKAWTQETASAFESAEKLAGAARAGALSRLAAQLAKDAATNADPSRVKLLAATVKGMAAAK